MKKKTLSLISILITILLVSSVVVYAAFVMTHNYEANIKHHEITITEGTGENLTSILSNTVTNNDLTFNQPGDVVEVKYTLKNVDKRNYQYYYTLSTSSNDQKLLNMIYVYQNNEYCGVLSECLTNGLLEPEYIFADETGIETLIKFELHNGASSYLSGTVTLPVVVTCNIETTNYQEVLFTEVDSEGKTINFDKIIDDINSVPGKTIVLTTNVATTEAYTIANNCTIDLCGKTLTLGADVTIAPGVEVEIIDSRTNGAVDGAGKFVLNSEDSFIKLEANLPQANLTATKYNQERLHQELTKRYTFNNLIVCGQEYDLLGEYVSYDLTVTSSDLTVTNGIVQAVTSTKLDTNKVVDFLIDGTLYEFKYIGNDEAVFTSIISNDLAHLANYVEDNKARVSNNIFLPTVIKEHNATISWFSSNETVMNNEGVIQTQDGSIELVATIKLYDKVFTHTYYINVVQEDNLTKLQTLATQVEIGTTLTAGTETTDDDVIADVVLTEIGEDGRKPLPVAGDANKNSITYYTNWVDGKNLGITKLEYAIDSSYSFLSLLSVSNPTTQPTTSHFVYLNQMTFAKTARVKMIGTFDNGEVHEVYINVKIELKSSPEFEEEIYRQIQEYLDSVSVLDNILATRESQGALYESGDFEVISKIQDVDIRYSVPDAQKDQRSQGLYDVVMTNNSDGTVTTEVVFKDYRLFGLTDEKIKISVEIYVDGKSVSAARLLTFTIPGAVTTTNFPSMNFDNSNDLKRIFYSFKYQTLQQSSTPYYTVYPTETKPITTLVSLTDKAAVYELGNIYDYATKSVITNGAKKKEYILMYDIENTEELIFEYNSEEVIIDKYDIEVFKAIINWSTSTTNTGNKVSDNDFKNYIDGFDWVASDGSTTLSDAEIKVILNYCERYQGFLERWDDIINVGDNILDDSDISKLLEILSSDKVFISILKWIIDPSGQANTLSIYDWLMSKSGINWSSEYAVEINEFIYEQITNDINAEYNSLDDNELLEVKQYYYSTLNESEVLNSLTLSIYNGLTEADKELYTRNGIRLTLTEEELAKEPEEIEQIITTKYNSLTNEKDKIEYAQLYITTMVSENDKIEYAYSQLDDDEEKNNILSSYKLLKVEEIYNNLSDKQREEYTEEYFEINLARILKVKSSLLSIENDGLATVSDDGTDGHDSGEESVIIHYVMANYSNGEKYTKFYEAWTSAIKRVANSTVNESNVDNGLVKKIQKNDFGSYIYHYQNGFLVDGINKVLTLNQCYDPIFVKIIEWATYTLSKVTTSQEIDNRLTLENYLGESIPEILSGDKNKKNSWFYRSIARHYFYNTQTSTDEWSVITKYLSLYDIVSVNIAGTTVNLSTINVSAASTYVEHLNVHDYYIGEINGGFSLTHDFINELIEEVNNKYLSQINSYNKLVDWAKSNDKKYVIYSDVIVPNNVDTNNDGVINELDTQIPNVESYRIKDGFTSISSDEYDVLWNGIDYTFDYIVINKTGDLSEDDKTLNSYKDNLKTILRNYHINLQMKFFENKNVLDSESYKNVLMSIDNSIDFQTIIEEITKLEQYNGPSNSGYDGLDTISKDELIRLATAYASNGTFIEKLNELVNTYQITQIETEGNTKNQAVLTNGKATATEASVDRTFEYDKSADDYDSKIKLLLYGASNILSYKYLSINKIDSNEINAFEVLRYYVNLNELTFRGEKSNFLFASSNDANETLKIVSKNATSLTKLVMNYCGLSNISSITTLTKLLDLDLRGNFTTKQTVGGVEYSYSGINNINPLIELAQNKNIAKLTALQYLNVYNTDVTSSMSEVSLGKLYSYNNSAKLWYDYAGFETLYVPKSASENYLTAIEVLSLLYEITKMEGDYIVLPNTVYTTTNTSYNISWKVEGTNGLVKYNSGLNRIEKINGATKGTVVICATCTIGAGTEDVQTASRYFVVELQ